MKRTLAFAALAALTATMGFAAPASATPFENINARQAQIAQRIDFGQRSGRLNFVEARNLRADLRQVDLLEGRYRRGGLNVSERADLNRRLDRVEFNLQRELNDRDHRDDGHRDRHGY